MNLNTRLEKIANLEIIDTKEKNSPVTILMLHGYGANAFDLFPLKQELNSVNHLRWIFPNGRIELEMGGHFSARAWFPINIMELEQAMRTGHHRDLSKQTPAALSKSRDAILEMLEELKIPMEQIIIGGFSQGAMLATEVALYSKIKPKALIILSGNLINENEWKRSASSANGLTFFQSHGSHDPLLSLKGAQKLEILLKSAGLKGELQVFRGQHEIPLQIIEALDQFLNQVINKN